MEKTLFNLWLEFEAMQWKDWDPADDFCNIAVDFPDGRRYGINVWTYQYFLRSIRENETMGENLDGLYVDPPDLFVKVLSRECIVAVITDLVSKGDLEEILNPSTFNFRYPSGWVTAEDIPDQGREYLDMLNGLLKPGHPLYQREFRMEAGSNEQLVIQLNDKTLALVFTAGNKDEPGFPITEFFGDKKHFWTARIKRNTKFN